eukprot:200067-Pleurochrysis_carterae.AAC.1
MTRSSVRGGKLVNSVGNLKILSTLVSAISPNSSKLSCLHDRRRTQTIHEASYIAAVLLLRYMLCFYDLATKYLE